MERWSFRIVDVFTDRPLAGNQLAVFEDAAGIPESLLQPLAQEIGYSETVFAYPGRQAPTRGSASSRRRARCRSPVTRCWGRRSSWPANLGKDRVVLETGRGPVPVRIDREPGPATRGAMEQPIPIVRTL